MPPLSIRQQPDVLARLASAQEGVVSRAQLLSAGYDADAVRRRIAAARWHPLGVAIVLHNGELTRRDRQWAALLSAPGWAAISGRAASSRWGLKGFEPDAIDVLVPADSKPIEIDGVRWRRCRRPELVVTAKMRGPAIAVPARSVVDAARWTSSARIACALLAAAVQQRVTSAAGLRRQLEQAGSAHHRHALLTTLADIEGGADSLAEIDFVKLARKAGLPPPIRQSVRLDSRGRRRYLDVDFGTFVVEVDGGIHLRPLTYWADALRQNELVLGGDRILRFPSIAIRLDEAVVIAQLRRAKAVFG